MLHPVRGVLAVEGVQTGDGRYFTPGALSWAPLPQPLAWMVDGDQHIDLATRGPQIGTITQIARVGADLTFAGFLDDDIPEARELLRRMDAGSAGFGHRVGLSIDGDDYAFELVFTGAADDADDELFLVASGAGMAPRTAGDAVGAITAAAGDGNPIGETWVTDASDELVLRFTRLRIRGATACAVPAFDGAYMERAAAPAAGGLVAAATVARPAAPYPAGWFTDPQLDGPTPLTVTAEGRVFGHIATWDTCHIGYTDRCITPPHSPSGYAHAHTRPPVDLDDGTTIRPGGITVGTGHASLSARPTDAAAHYDHTGYTAALVRYGEDPWGIWAAGVVAPGATDEQVDALRTSATSGDWRRIDGALELVAVLSVNVPGFPIPDFAVAASAAGECTALVAAGAVRAHEDPELSPPDPAGADVLVIDTDPGSATTAAGDDVVLRRAADRIAASLDRRPLGSAAPVAARRVVPLDRVPAIGS